LDILGEALTALDFDRERKDFGVVRGGHCGGRDRQRRNTGEGAEGGAAGMFHDPRFRGIFDGSHD
jgi:hypothetical protein